jgi:hypothetical protein
VKLSAGEIRAAYYAVEQIRLAGGFQPPSVTALGRRLAKVISVGEVVTQPRHDSSGSPFDATQLEGANELCRSQLAASICDRSVRWVHRNYKVLGGVKVDGLGYVFNVEAVRRYANQMMEVDDDQP